MKPVAIDIFCGAGGLSEGLTLAGFDVRLAIDADPYACMVFAQNHRSTLTLWQDVAKLKKLEPTIRAAGVRKSHVSLIAGGPPCRGFSTANRRTNRRDNAHNRLVSHFLRIVREIKPRAVLMENVEGLRSFDDGSVLNHVIRQLDRMGYEVDSRVLNAADYGVPQLRRRILVVASMTGGFEWPRATHGPAGNDPWLPVSDALQGDLPPLNGSTGDRATRYAASPRTAYQRAMRRSCSILHDHITTASGSHVRERFALIPPGSGLFYLERQDRVPRNLRISIGHRGVYRRLDPSRPSITISNVSRSLTIHPTEHRIISLREAARLQSFRDSYRFPGSIGKMQQALGNAVPPMLARAIARRIYDIVN